MQRNTILLPSPHYLCYLLICATIYGGNVSMMLSGYDVISGNTGYLVNGYEINNKKLRRLYVGIRYNECCL